MILLQPDILIGNKRQDASKHLNKVKRTTIHASQSRG